MRGKRLVAACLAAVFVVSTAAAAHAQGYTGALIKAHERALELKCMNNLKQIHIALTMYRNDHGDKWPVDLEALVKGKYITQKVLQCPGARSKKGSIDYGLARTAKRRLKPSDIIVYDRKGSHKDVRNVLLVDGQVLWLTEAKFRKRMGNEPYQ